MKVYVNMSSYNSRISDGKLEFFVSRFNTWVDIKDMFQEVDGRWFILTL